jgi:general stress protein YciG
MPSRGGSTEHHREAGRKGGHVSGGNNRAGAGRSSSRSSGESIGEKVLAGAKHGGEVTSSDREHMSEIGRLGGEAYHEKRGATGHDKEPSKKR